MLDFTMVMLLLVEVGARESEVDVLEFAWVGEFEISFNLFIRSFTWLVSS